MFAYGRNATLRGRRPIWGACTRVNTATLATILLLQCSADELMSGGPIVFASVYTASYWSTADTLHLIFLTVSSCMAAVTKFMDLTRDHT